MKKDTKGTVLLIEDEPGFRRIYTSVFKYAGYDVLEAEDGEKGLQMVQKHRPSIVLLDLLLPKMNGFDVLKKIRETDGLKTVPVIIFTVLGEKREIGIGLSIGANDYITKGNSTPKQILDKLEEILATSSQQAPRTPYYLSPHKNRGDSLKLQKDFNLPEALVCPHCEKSLVLDMEAEPNPSTTTGRRFIVQFYCKSCEKSF
jgi:DNA-binding response OmpR family regulator